MEQTPKPSHQPAGLPPSMRGRSPQPRPASPQRPTTPPPPTPQRVASPKPTQAPKSKKSFTFAAVGIGIVSVIVIVAAVVMGFTKLMAGNEVKTGTDQYQAVFLSNNMVYFGKVSNVTGEYIKMTDIYYLQVNQQQSTDQKTQTQQQQQLSLAKLGNELHGPEDAMYINRKEVLFWENLKPEGKVVQAIKNHKAGK